MKRTILLILAAVFLLLGCSASTEAETPDAAAQTAGITVVPETGLLTYSDELPDDMFVFEIMPNADDEIYEIIMDYYGGEDKEYLGQLVFAPVTESYFTRDETFRRGFQTKDEGVLKNFTLAFSFKDAEGEETAARNEYTVDAEFGINYFVEITGSRENGYYVSDGT